MNRCTRRAWAQMGIGCTLGLLAGLAQAGGATNLMVEWRVVASASGQAQRAGVTAGGVQLSTQDVSQRQDSVHSLTVLNGGRARLYVGQSVPQTNWQFIFSVPTVGASGAASTGSASGAQASAGAQLVSQTTWIDLGQGLSVHPHWPGGRAPVKVEIEAQSRQAAGPAIAPDGIAPDGAIQRQEVATTLSMPLGQWVVLAQTRSNYMQSVRGTWSTRDIDDQGGQQLEVRITAP
ncbi:MAG: hypothetical protein KGI91_05665 [Burkholderiales bacterium]|nr:hypothetical protein [Burkholderiales bacterium]MDE2076551.1 hypothetical protein [Burkholderiales bacterium]HET8693596.1 hypothetical protein [Aquabacterium sp.]